MGINANLDEMTEEEKNFYYFKVCIRILYNYHYSREEKPLHCDHANYLSFKLITLMNFRSWSVSTMAIRDSSKCFILGCIIAPQVLIMCSDLLCSSSADQHVRPEPHSEQKIPWVCSVSWKHKSKFNPYFIFLLIVNSQQKFWLH